MNALDGAPPIRGHRRTADLEAGTGRWDWATGWPGNQDRQRVILVELEPTNVMLIAIDDTNSQESFDALVAEAMPIVESFEFPH